MKVLFIINGLGLGNSTRCHAIIQRLSAKSVEVEIVTSGNGLWYFADKSEVATINEISSLAYGSKDGEISVFRTFAKIPEMLATIRRNTRVLEEILERIRPDVVVSDSDYNFLPVKRSKVPLVALNNADIIWDSYFQFGDAPSSVRPQFYGVEMLDCGFHRIVPDIVLSPTFDERMKSSRKNVRRIGPIIRQDYEARPVKAPAERAAVMLSGSIFGTPVVFDRDNYPLKIDVIGREAPEGWLGPDNVTFHGKIKATYPLIKEADISVVNGGFSAVSEMFCLRKPLVVVPVPRHAEQWVNARTIEHLGVGRMATVHNYEEIMLDALKDIGRYRDAYAALPPMRDGASDAADAIIEIAARTG